jgi:hypothetical protein
MKDGGDIAWMENIFNELSKPHGATIKYSGSNGEFQVVRNAV